MTIPSSWFRAASDGDLEQIDTAIIMGFGFERTMNGEMSAGAANQFLLEHLINAYPNVETLFVQEGVWVGVCAQAALTCQVKRLDGEPIALYRIDRHDDTVDLHTMDIAVCALERMVQFNKREAILIAHDLQLWRAAENFSRAAPLTCPECQILTGEVPDSPYPLQSEQLRTRYERLFMGADLIARIRDRLQPGQIPRTCPMPMGNSQ
ncbi:MAG: hypothetical protein AAF633_26570 [Chloroflexota bacterium]